MSVQVTPHPEWVVDLDRALEPHRLAVLTTPVVEHSAENTLVEQRMQDFLIAFYPISVGAVDASIVHPAQVFGPALRELGVSRVILVHSHPSGDPRPSLQDVKLTRELCKAGKLLGIEVVDHVILGDGARWSSMAEDGFVRSASRADVKAKKG